jgi:hypothetical protein
LGSFSEGKRTGRDVNQAIADRMTDGTVDVLAKISSGRRFLDRRLVSAVAATSIVNLTSVRFGTLRRF